MTIKKTRKPDGSTDLRVGHEHFNIPARIRILSSAEFKSYGKGVKERVESCIAKNWQKDDAIQLLAVPTTAYFARALVGHGNGQIHVLLQARLKNVGWAVFKDTGRQLIEEGALIAPSCQRQGFYSALVRALKKEVRPVVLSDNVLTVANALRWMRHGTYDEMTGRFRANPKRRRPSARAVKQAVKALFTRDATV